MDVSDTSQAPARRQKGIVVLVLIYPTESAKRGVIVSIILVFLSVHAQILELLCFTGSLYNLNEVFLSGDEIKLFVFFWFGEFKVAWNFVISLIPIL